MFNCLAVRSARTSAAAILACASLFATLTTAAAAFADEPQTTGAGQKREQMKLGVGDPAPGLEIEHWVKGDPITGFEKGRVYVVEFWATWCGPCIASMPHLTEMQRKFKNDGVTIIGVNGSTSPSLSPQRLDTLEKVQAFLAKHGERMGYTVAMDGPETRTYKAFMEAAGRRGIPCSFVVDRESKIAWIGHPMGYLESVVEDVIVGKFDAAKQQEMEAKAEEAMTAANQAADAGEWDRMQQKLAEFRELHRTHAKRADRMEFMALLTGKKDYGAAYALGDKLVTGQFKDEAMALNQMSWMILTEEGIEERDLDLAMKAAVRANELTKGEDAGVLDTLARAHFDKGDVSKAIEVQSKAVELASDESMKEELQATLERYVEAQKSK